MKRRLMPALSWLLASTAVFACSGDEEYRTYFNIPPVGGEIFTVKDALLAYINGAQPGSEIRGHITSIGSDSVASSLINAAKQGATVLLVANGAVPGTPEPGSPSAALQNYFGARHKFCYDQLPDINPYDSRISYATSCVSPVPGATHHIKNWAFSHTVVDGEELRNAVWVTSMNLTRESDGQFNDAFVAIRNEELYAAFLHSFQSFFHQNRTDDFYNVAGRGHHVLVTGDMEVSYSPQKASAQLPEDDPGQDYVALALSKIDTGEPGCALKVANLSFARSRDAILYQLYRIRNLGCVVQIAYTNDYLYSSRAVLLAAQVALRMANANAIHSKMMLYNGHYDGAPRRALVWGGSHNWNDYSLREHDEVFVRISNRGVYAGYSA